MSRIMKMIGLDHAIKQKQIEQKEKEIVQSKKLTDLKEQESQEKQRQLKIANVEIDHLNDEKEEINTRLDNIIKPVGIDINIDLISASEEYYDLRKDVDTLRVEVNESSKNVVLTSYLNMLKLALSILIVFVATRIIGDNDEFGKLINAFEIVQHLYPSVSKESALMVNLFLQDTLFIASVGMGMGVAYNRFSKFKSTDAIIYASIGLIFSLILMQLASMFSAM